MSYGQNQDFKKQRQKLVLEIRKENREAHFNKRRNKQVDASFLQVEVDLTGSQQVKPKTSKVLIVDEERRQAIEKQDFMQFSFIKIRYFPQMFPEMVTLLYSENILEKHHGIIGIRKILSLNDTPPISLVFEYNILPMIIECMKQNTYPHMKLEATWIVSNIATGGPEQVTALMQYNVIPLLTSFLLQNKPGIADQAIWAVGNLAGDSPTLRDQLIDAGGIDATIHFINNTEIRANLIQGVWALSNMCRGSPLPEYKNIEKAVPVLCKVVNLNVLDEQNLSDCLWAISYSIEGPKERINYFLESKAITKVIEHAKSHLLSIASPALRIIGTVSTGNEVQTQILLDNKILDTFEELLDSNKLLVRRQVCWALSNIAAGSRNQVDQLLARQKILSKLVLMFELDSSEIKREICYIFANMGYLGDKAKVKNLLLSKEVMRFYGQCIIQKGNLKSVETCLDTLPMLFDFGERMKTSSADSNFVIQKFLSYPGVSESFEQLHLIQSEKIYEKALKIYEKYFDVDEDESKMEYE